MEKKWCTGCNTEHYVTEFGIRNDKKKDGTIRTSYRSQCKKYINEKNRLKRNNKKSTPDFVEPKPISITKKNFETVAKIVKEKREMVKEKISSMDDPIVGCFPFKHVEEKLCRHCGNYQPVKNFTADRCNNCKDTKRYDDVRYYEMNGLSLEDLKKTIRQVPGLKNHIRIRCVQDMAIHHYELEVIHYSPSKGINNQLFYGTKYNYMDLLKQAEKEITKIENYKPCKFVDYLFQ